MDSRFRGNDAVGGGTGSHRIAMPKRYDQDYFDRWYRHPRHRVKSSAELERKVRMTVAVAEYFLERPLRSVLDVGCGEGAWLAPLRELRPKVRYLGVDDSEYAIARYGASRNLRRVAFDALASLRDDGPFDLLVCSDVMHYVPTATLMRGLPAFQRLCTGAAFLEVFCKGEEFVGDHDGFIARTATWYRRAFAAAGWQPCGSQLYLGPALRERATSLELVARPS
jgi:SAM-dependent methyltransferase